MMPTALSSFGALIGWIDVFFPILFSWSALYFGIRFWLEWDSQRDKADRANFVAEEAKLQMLRYQLNPHFLFNALNSIRAMISENDSQARSMVTELSEFLRYQLIFRDDKETLVKDEIEAVKHYLCIEKRRYEEKLIVSFEIDPQIENYPILSFLIHPLVENAVKYGMKTSKLPLTVRVKADQIENGVRLSVINSGNWIDHTTNNGFGKDGTGTGLTNVKERLKVKFPDHHKFDYFEKDNHVNVIIELTNHKKN
jgi:two-component system, LytTR family, sensor kinase